MVLLGTGTLVPQAGRASGSGGADRGGMALGFRIEDPARGTAVAFTSDSGSGRDLVRLVAGVDLLVAECGDGMRPLRGRHLDVESLIRLVGEGGLGRVAVTHLDPRQDRTRVIAALADALGDRVIEARDGLELWV